MIFEYGETPRTIMQNELSGLMRRIIDNHVNAGQMASGRTAKSLRVEVNSDGEGTLYSKSPFGVLETGRRPGNVPQNFGGIIRQWMKDKGIEAAPIPYVRPGKHKYTEQERGNMAMAWAIATSIKKHGTALFRDGGRNDIYSREIADVKERIAQRFGQFITTQIQSIKLNTGEKIK